MGLGRFLRRNARKALGTVLSAAPIPGAGIIGGIVSGGGGRRNRGGLLNTSPQGPLTLGAFTPDSRGFLETPVGLGGMTVREQLRGGLNFAGGLPGIPPGLGNFIPQAPTLPSGGGMSTLPATIPKGNLPITLAPLQKTINTAMDGYTLVERISPGGMPVKFQINTAWARENGFKLPKKASKPPISAGDWKKLKAAERVKGKVKRISKAAGMTCRPSGSRARR